MGNGEREAHQSENMLKTLIENSIPSTWKKRLILLIVISIKYFRKFYWNCKCNNKYTFKSYDRVHLFSNFALEKTTLQQCKNYLSKSFSDSICHWFLAIWSATAIIIVSTQESTLKTNLTCTESLYEMGMKFKQLAGVVQAIKSSNSRADTGCGLLEHRVIYIRTS